MEMQKEKGGMRKQTDSICCFMEVKYINGWFINRRPYLLVNQHQINQSQKEMKDLSLSVDDNVKKEIITKEEKVNYDKKH